MMMIPGALVVLFNPSAAHISNLLYIKKLCRDVIAVDNSPIPDLDFHDSIRAKGVDVLSNFNRGGVAGAYNKGFEFLVQKGCALLFIFDQDSIVPEDYFLQMTKACHMLGKPLFLMGPKIFDINVSRYLPAHIISKWGIRPIPIDDQDRGLLPCSSIISSGTVISSEAYRILGPFLEDYFIDHVDTEYSFRAIRKAVPIYINTKLTLRHEIGKRIDHKVLFLKLIQWNMSPLRQYYSARNCVRLAYQYGAQFPLVALINVITVLQVISVVLYERDKWNKMLAMTAGILDGICNRCGTFESCHSKLFYMVQGHKGG